MLKINNLIDTFLKILWVVVFFKFGTVLQFAGKRVKVAITCKICQLLETYLRAHWILMKAVWSWERWAVRPYSSYFLQGPPALAPPAQPTVHPNKKRKVSTCHTAKYQAYFNICAKKKSLYKH